MISTSDALIAIADSILDKITQLKPVEITKKGRKYKFINNTFQRIQKEDKHLIINPDELDKGYAALSAYRILFGISADIFQTHPDLCLMIIGVAQELERNGWYEEENSSVINYKVLRFLYVQENANTALRYASAVTPRHLRIGYNILYSSKLNFFHTDHHIGARLEGMHVRQFVEENFGPEALELHVVLVALKSFVHWGNIKGLLYKLDVPNMEVDTAMKQSFALFPDPPQELKDYVYARPPSGTSKYFLVRKALNMIVESPYAPLMPYPSADGALDPESIYVLCKEIQENPVSYHLRSDIKRLAIESVMLGELSQKYEKIVKELLVFIGLIVNTFTDDGFEFLLQNSKIPKMNEQLLETHKSYYNELLSIHDKITDYELKGWNTEDIVVRLRDKDVKNVYDSISELRSRYPEDPRLKI